MAGCDTTGSKTEAKDAQGPIEAAYVLNSDIVRAADRLKEATIQKCMTDRGLRYDVHVMTPATATALAVTEHLDNQLVLTEWYGYHDASRVFSPPPTTADPNQSRIDAMTDAERTAYLNALNATTSTSPSCSSVGESAYADAIVGPATQRLGELYGDLLVRVRADSAVTATQAAWQGCMRVDGLEFTSRAAIIDDLKARAAQVAAAPPSQRTAEISQLEQRAKTLAEADVRCDKEVGLERTTIDVQLAAERKLANTEAALLEEVARERTHVLKQET
ncbi:MAG: hypothetical protein RLZZ623_850 [Actinomycetota bacterium]|jgi:hypothetical protein